MSGSAAQNRGAGRVGLVSLGCAKNLVDSEHLTASLLGAGFRITPRLHEADVLLVNTCAFIHDAREEAIRAILEACERKKSGRCRGVIVTGCLPQRYRADLMRAIPEADAFLGLDALDRAGEIALRVLAGERGIHAITAQARRLFEPGADRVLLSGGPYAYIKIAEGCNHRCAFCAIPAIRGRHRSRPTGAIVREAEGLLARGVRELNLISQDTTWYGRDRKDGTDLSSLLKALDRLGGRFWVRILYGYPTGVTDDLLDAIGSSAHVLPYFDIPVQHADPAVLRAMGRAGTADAVAGLTARIRARLPAATVRTTCLTGHPGETAAAFRRLVEYVRESGFDHLGVFTFSAEEGTPAAGLRPRPGAALAERRRDELLTVQAGVADARWRARAGEADEFLVERAAGGRAWGRTRRQAPEVDGRTLVAGGWADGHGPGTFARVRDTGRRRGADRLAEVWAPLGVSPKNKK